MLRPISILRPKFRAIAQALTDMVSVLFPLQGAYSLTSKLQDHVFVEEAFERLLLDYDRVFSAMGIPACVWRRTGEIVKGNREFAELIGIDGHMLRDVSVFAVSSTCAT
jgi:PAS domain-containing protein